RERGLLVEADLVPALVLGAVEGLVRGAEEAVGGDDRARGVAAHAQAGGDPELLAGAQPERAHLPPHAFGDGEGAGEVGLGEEDGELLAAVAGDDVGLADGLAEGGGQVAEHLVPHLVAVGLVDVLEVVEVEEEQRQRVVVALGAAELLAEAVLEVAVVVDGGEPVGDGETVEPGALLQHLVEALLGEEGAGDAGADLLLVPGPGDDVVGAHAQRLQLLRRVLAVEDDDHRDVAAVVEVAQLLEDLQPVHARDVGGGEDQVHLVVAGDLEALGAVGGEEDVGPLGAGQRLQRRQLRGVLEDQHQPLPEHRGKYGTPPAMAKRPSLSLFFPAWNEEDYVERAVSRAVEVLQRLTDDWEIIVVNDASTDRTQEIAEGLSARHKQVRVISHPVNLKLGGAMRTG